MLSSISFTTNGIKIQTLLLENSIFKRGYDLLQCPIKTRVFHQDESCLACPHPPSSYEGGREQVH